MRHIKDGDEQGCDRQAGADPKQAERRAFARAFCGGLLAVALIACGDEAARRPADSAPKPETAAAGKARFIRAAVYSYTGTPMPLHVPEKPVPVRKVVVRT